MSSCLSPSNNLISIFMSNCGNSMLNLPVIYAWACLTCRFFNEEAGLKFALTVVKENKVGKNVWNPVCFYQRTGEGIILGHSECCWDIATTYLWQSARNSLSAIFVFLWCIKIGQWTVTLLLPPSISRELVRPVFVIHTLCQDSSSKLVFTKEEETKRLAEPLSLH